MNIAEAKMCWCPFARAISPVVDQNAAIVDGIAINRTEHSEPDSDCLCLAERCMAWRWLDRQNRKGYCGLAGKPTD